MRLRAREAVPDHWRRAVRLSLAISLLGVLGYSLVSRPAYQRGPLVLVVKWAMITLPVVTMPLLGVSAVGPHACMRTLCLLGLPNNAAKSSRPCHLAPLAPLARQLPERRACATPGSPRPCGRPAPSAAENEPGGGRAHPGHCGGRHPRLPCRRGSHALVDAGEGGRGLSWAIPRVHLALQLMRVHAVASLFCINPCPALPCPALYRQQCKGCG